MVGSRGTHRAQEARAARLGEWAEDMHRRRPTWFLRSPFRALTRLRKPPIDAVGSYAVHSIHKHTDATHSAALALLDELLAIGVRDERVSARVVAARARALDTAA